MNKSWIVPHGLGNKGDLRGGSFAFCQAPDSSGRRIFRLSAGNGYRLANREAVFPSLGVPRTPAGQLRDGFSASRNRRSLKPVFRSMLQANRRSALAARPDFDTA